MLIIPMGTDAPIYHWPRVTVGMIVLNALLFLAVPPPSRTAFITEDGDIVEAPVSTFDRLALTLGDGLHPVQWVTHNFLHYGFTHLLGNAIFLWAFGIVIEGKLGPWKYLAMYLAIGTLHGALVQIALLRSGVDGHAAGASAVVYGLLAACMVWAPRNELNCVAFFFAGFRMFIFNWELYYTTVALFYIGGQAFWFGLFGLGAGRLLVSEMGHLSGAFWGAVLAVLLLRLHLVDCEDWDIFSLIRKRRRLASDWKQRGEMLDRRKTTVAKVVKEETVRKFQEPDHETRGAAALRRIREMIERDEIDGALSAYDKSARTLVQWPAQPDLYDLIKLLHARKAEAPSVPLLRDHCKYFPDAPESSKVRLKLAQILIRDMDRPGEALRHLGAIPSGSLKADLESARRKLIAKAEAMREEGVLELEGDQ
jgi:membrane associated rhomboid family serine protease